MHIRILAVPYDSGARGVRMGAGPARLLDGGLAEHLRSRGCRVEVEWVEAGEEEARAEIRTAFELARRLARATRRAVEAGALPLVLAGNCNSAVGTLAGSGAAGVVWLDAHGDLHTPETSTSGFLDGMALAVVTGRCWTGLASSVPGFHPVEDGRVLLLGARDLDPAEAELLGGSAIRRIASGALPEGVEPALATLAARAPTLYVHLDLDVLDPGEGRANGFAAPGGVSREALAETLAAVRRRARVSAVALTAYDPACDPEGRVCRAAEAALDALLGGDGRGVAADPSAGETSSASAR